jgi:hypothetical protein
MLILLGSATPAPYALGLPLRRHDAAGLHTTVAGAHSADRVSDRACG